MSDVELPATKEFLNRYPFQISGGQCQRVIIALALLLSPKVLIADEPTTALDVFVQEQILVLIKTLIKKRNMSMILITHNMGVVYKVADEVIVMKDAKIVEVNTPKVLFQNPRESYTKRLIASLPPKDITVKKIPSERDWNTAEDLQLIEQLDLLSHREKKDDALQSETSEYILECKNISFSVPLTKYFPIKDFLKHQIKNQVKKQMKKQIQNQTPNQAQSQEQSFVWKKERTIINDVSFRIKKGTALGLVGESGSGKSTLAKLIVGLEERPQGIYYNGQALFHKEVMRDIQMIFQSPYSSLNPQKTLRNIFAIALKIKNKHISKDEIEEKNKHLVELIGLPHASLDKKPPAFSGGQLQRICIARALILSPSLLLCDEPTSALDISVQADILNLLKYLQTTYNISMLFISHDLPVVRYMCDEIVVLKDGQIVEMQDTESLFNSPQQAYTKNLIDLIPNISSDISLN